MARGDGRWSTTSALVVVMVVGPSGCTEPNPYLPVASGSSDTTDPSTGGPDGSGPGSSTSESGGSSSGPALGECAQMGMACVEGAPEGWAGPFAWLERPEQFEPVPCPAPYDQQLTEAFSDIAAPAAQCDCSCFDPVGTGCGPGLVERTLNDDCTGAVLDSMEVVQACQGTGGWAPSGGYRFTSPPVVGGQCQPLLDVSVEDASFLTRHRACAASLVPLDCEAGQVCAPTPFDPFEDRLCIWQEGDVPCPEGSSYSEHARLFRSIDDARGCNPCTCGEPTGVCEGSTVDLHTGGGFCDSEVGALTPGDCMPAPAQFVSQLLHIEGTPRGECEPSAPIPTGDASGAEPLTFCCTP